MKALFLVGGSGTRLRPLTNDLPKPMIPLMGRPLLARTFERLREAGITEIVLSACYKPLPIIRYFGDGAEFGLSLTYVLEEEPLGTGGAIKNAEEFLKDDRFFVFNADILSDFSLRDMLLDHLASGAAVTIAGTRVDDTSAYGVLEYDAGGRIRQFVEKPRPGTVKSHYINAGIYLFEPEVLRSIPAGRWVSVEREVFPTLLARGEHLGIFCSPGYWMDIGTPEKYLQSHTDAFEGRLTLSEPLSAGIYIDPEAAVADDISIEAPAYIGRGATVGSGCALAGHVVVGEGAVIGAGSTLSHCIVWPGAKLPAHSKVTDTVVAPGPRAPVFYPYHDMGIAPERKLVHHEAKH